MKPLPLLVVAMLVIGGLLVMIPANATPRRAEVEVQTEYTIDGYQTDAARAIDMAERVATQSQQSNQLQLARIEAKLDRLMETAAGIDKQLVRLDMRLAAIEKHLGIVVPPPPPAQDLPKPQGKLPQAGSKEMPATTTR